MIKAYLTGAEGLALADLSKSLKAQWPGVKFKLFGSKVKGGGDPESDIDLLVLLPCEVTEEIRKDIIHRIFEINLSYESSISAVILSEEEWTNSILRHLPFHASVEREGISL